MAQTLPTVFIGSSTEGLDVAREVEIHLQSDAMPTIWKDGVFGLGYGVLESLMNTIDQYDFAVMVLSPDDLAESRGQNYASPRDNVIFELGLFMGRLGRSRTFIVYAADADLKLPSDLAGITVSPYHSRNNLAAALSPACTPIIKAIRSLGVAEHRVSQQLDQVRQRVQEHEWIINAVTTALEFGVTTSYEYEKLEGLERDGSFWCRHHGDLLPEMKRLFDRGFVRETQLGSGPGIENYRGSKQEFDLKNHFLLTNIGRKYLECRREWQKYVKHGKE